MANEVSGIDGYRWGDGVEWLVKYGHVEKVVTVCMSFF